MLSKLALKLPSNSAADPTLAKPMKIEKELMGLCERDIQSKLRTTLLSIKGPLVHEFKRMFLIFK